MSLNDARLGLKAAGLWTLVEFAVRWGLIVVAGGGFVLLSGKVPRESDVEPFVGMAVAVPLGLAAVALAVIFRRRATRERLGLDDLGYRFERHRVLAGFASGLFLLLAAWAASHIDLALFPDAAMWVDLLIRLMASGGPVVVVAMVVANGILGPVVEEYAWRGYIQHRLTRAWGIWTGLAVTALVFAAKHTIVDVSFGRITTLLVFACGLGLIRQRWGTVASTVAHVTANTSATLYVFATALRS